MRRRVAPSAGRIWNPSSSAPQLAATGAFICVGLCVAATRFAVSGCDTLTLAFLRNGIAFVLLFPFLRRASREVPIRRPDLILLGEKLTPALAVGAIFVVSGIVLVNRPESRRREATHGTAGAPENLIGTTDDFHEHQS